MLKHFTRVIYFVYHLFEIYASYIQMRTFTMNIESNHIAYLLSQTFSHNVFLNTTDNTEINIQVKSNKRKLFPIAFDHACSLSSRIGLLILRRN